MCIHSVVSYVYVHFQYTFLLDNSTDVDSVSQQSGK